MIRINDNVRTCEYAVYRNLRKVPGVGVMKLITRVKSRSRSRPLELATNSDVCHTSVVYSDAKVR